MNVRPAAVAIEDDVFHHRAAQFFAARARIVDQDRNEIERAVKDLPGSLLTPCAEIIPAGAVDEGSRLKDRFGAIDRQLRPLVAGTLVLAAVFCTQLREVDAF